MTLPDFLIPMAMQDTPGGRRGPALPGCTFGRIIASVGLTIRLAE